MASRPVRYTHEYFINEVQRLEKDKDYEILSNCENSNSLMTIRHKLCGKEFSVVAKEFIRQDPRYKNTKGTGCTHCYRSNSRTIDDYIKYVNDNMPEYEVLNMYSKTISYPNHKKRKRTKHRLAMKHLVCENVFDILAESVVGRSSGCPECARKVSGLKQRLDIDSLRVRIREAVGEEYIVPEDAVYTTYFKYIKIKHATCGYEYEIQPSEFLRPGRYSHRCPVCKKKQNQSTGEIYISEILNSLDVTYEKEKRFDDCRNVNPLSFDFYVPELNVCIEFDGIQHYESIEFWGGLAALEKRQYLDEIKNEYCSLKKIPLLRIKYDQESQMEEILTNFIHETQNNNNP